MRENESVMNESRRRRKEICDLPVDKKFLKITVFLDLIFFVKNNGNFKFEFSIGQKILNSC